MIIVTGGAGFIGSAITACLNAMGYEDILIVDILGDDRRWKNLRRLRFTDYIEAEDFFDMLNETPPDWKVEAVFHMGACSDTTETDCSYLVKNNYDCSKVIADWAAKNGSRFIYASSAATYGGGEQGFSDDESRIENLVPLNMYGYSKQMFDLWMKKSGLLKKSVGLKFFNVFGPNEYHKGNMRSFIIKACEQIAEAGSVKLFKSHRKDYKDGCQERDFVYVKDAAAMAVFFMENPEPAGIFNVGTGKARNWNDLVSAVYSAMKKEPKIEYVPMPANIRAHYQYFTEADITKIRNAGYDKKISTLEEAVTDYVKNFLMKKEYISADAF